MCEGCSPLISRECPRRSLDPFSQPVPKKWPQSITTSTTYHHHRQHVHIYCNHHHHHHPFLLNMLAFTWLWEEGRHYFPLSHFPILFKHHVYHILTYISVSVICYLEMVTRQLSIHFIKSIILCSSVGAQIDYHSFSPKPHYVKLDYHFKNGRCINNSCYIDN